MILLILLICVCVCNINVLIWKYYNVYVCNDNNIINVY